MNRKMHRIQFGLIANLIQMKRIEISSLSGTVRMARSPSIQATKREEWNEIVPRRAFLL
jgi:hypothetical protein